MKDPVLARLGQEVFDGVLEAASPLMTKGCTPLDAESWASELLGMVGVNLSDPAMLQVFFGEVFAPMIERQPSPKGLAILRALGAVGGCELRTTIKEAADRIATQGVVDQPWALKVGAPKLGDMWSYGDVAGEQESLVLVFAYGRGQHAMCVFIDHSLGGGIKDVFVTGEVEKVLDRVRAMEQADPLVTLERIGHSDAREALANAVAAGECPGDDEQMEDVITMRALLQARLDLLSSAT